MKIDFLTINDLTLKQIDHLFDIAVRLKQEKQNSLRRQPLNGKSFALIFEKPSTRTYVSFNVAIYQLGGNPIILKESSFGGRESLYDIAKNLSRYVDGIIIRTYKQEDLEYLSKQATIPIINALTDKYHPCQIMADYLTIRERKGTKKLKIAYFGDGFNVANSLCILASKIGYDISFASPKGFEPNAEILKPAKRCSRETGANILTTTNPQEAATDADIIYTDTWTSMGKEKEEKERIKIFSPFQVNQELLTLAKKDAIVMHCLPAHRGQEITNAVIDGPQSVVFDQAENRLHMQKAILSWIFS